MRPIFCGNFEHDARQSDLERLFRKYGKVDRVDLKSGFVKPHYPNTSFLRTPMAARSRTLSRPVFTIFKSTISKPSTGKPTSPSSSSSVFGIPIRSSPTTALSRPLPQMGSLQSLLPLYTAVSSARLTSCLGLDSKGSRSLSQELGLSVPR